MDRLFEQKKKGELHFRHKINEFIQSSPFAVASQQLSTPVLADILQMPFFDGVCSNGRVNVEKLCEKVAEGEGSCSARELWRVLGGRKEMKVAQLHQILKSYQLHQFDLQRQIVRLLFEHGTLSLKKMDALMTSLNLPLLNTKDRELLVQCFDYNKDGVITKEDLVTLMQICTARDDLRNISSRQ